MSEEYYEKDGKLYQKGDFIFPDKEVGEFEKNWDGTSSVKDWLNNEIATQSKPDWFGETDVTVHGEEGHFSEPGILDLSGNRPFTPDPGEAAPSEPETTSAPSTGGSSGGGYSYGGSSTPQTKSKTSSDELTFGQSLLLAVLIVSVGAIGLHLYGFEKADKELRAFFSEVFQPTNPPTQSVEPPRTVTRSSPPHDSRQQQTAPKSDGKLHNPLDNKEFMDGIHNFLRGDRNTSPAQPTPYPYAERRPDAYRPPRQPPQFNYYARLANPNGILIRFSVQNPDGSWKPLSIRPREILIIESPQRNASIRWDRFLSPSVSFGTVVLDSTRVQDRPASTRERNSAPISSFRISSRGVISVTSQ